MPKDRQHTIISVIGLSIFIPFRKWCITKMVIYGKKIRRFNEFIWEVLNNKKKKTFLELVPTFKYNPIQKILPGSAIISMYDSTERQIGCSVKNCELHSNTPIIKFLFLVFLPIEEAAPFGSKVEYLDLK